MNDNDPDLDGLMVDLLKAVAPVAPPAALRSRVLEAITPAVPLITIRADEGGWREVHPGVSMRVLHRDAQGCSFLLRLLAGASFPEHDHPGNEECILLEGDLTLGDVTIHAGDYHLAPRGARHGRISSRGGALAFLRSANPAEYSA